MPCPEIDKLPHTCFPTTMLRTLLTALSAHSTRYELRGRAVADALCAGPFGSRVASKIGWLHVPKQGTTFLTTVLHHACKGLPSNASAASFLDRGSQNVWRDLHVAYNLSRSCLQHRLLDRRRAAQWKPHVPTRCAHVQREQIKPTAEIASSMAGSTFVRCTRWETRLVTMMRSPTQRILSGFHHEEGGPHGVAPADIQRIRASGPAAYATYCPAATSAGTTGTARGKTSPEMPSMDCIANQQCAFVLGRPCITPSDARAAVARLRGPNNAFTFVGLAEFWNASVCLFHRSARRPSEPAPHALPALDTRSARNGLELRAAQGMAKGRWLESRFGSDGRYALASRVPARPSIHRTPPRWLLAS